MEKRAYNSQNRQARAIKTKQRILQVAKKLFAKHGIDKVTIEELATTAEVSAPTIYSLFRSKAGILKALMEESLFGAKYTSLAKQSQTLIDPIESIKLTASIARTIWDAEKSEMGLIRGVSAFSPELKEIEAEFEKMRFELQETRANLLVEQCATARKLGIDKVRDVIWMFTCRDIYRMLVIERNWSSDAYEKWLANTLIQTLIVDTK